MKCLRRECDSDRSDSGKCPGCSLSLYCSPKCCLADKTEHRASCRSAFQVEDFADVKQGTKNQVLGKGAFGEVKLVVHKPTSTYFAMKTIEKEQAAEQLSLLRREISVHQQLVHPNIVRLYGCFEDLENVYLVLEYADKGNLFSEVRRKKGLPEEQARNYFLQVCRGIQYLHEKLVVHRDLKPENVLLTKKEEVKICDFGWCVEGLEVRQTFCGTVDYMAPEMILGEGHSFSIDVWALGVLLYEMLHGVAPWTGVKDAAKTEQILAVEYTCAPSLNPQVQDLIAQMLRKDPNERPSVSQLFLHPWLKQHAEEPQLSIGESVSYYLKGFGLAEGLVTAMDGETCTLFFEVNNSYQQVAIAKLLAFRKQESEAEYSEVFKPARRPEPKPNEAASNVRPASQPLSPASEHGLRLNAEDEAEILDKIEKWCQQPPKVPVKENQFMRELEESKRRLDESLAELKEKGSEGSYAPPKSLQSEAAPKAHEVKAVKLPSFLQDVEEDGEHGRPQVAPPNPQPPAAKPFESAASKYVFKPLPKESVHSSDEEEEEPAPPLPVPRRFQKSAVDRVLVKTRERELEQKLAKHQEELRKIAEELEKPALPKVKVKQEEKNNGVMEWLGNLFS